MSAAIEERARRQREAAEHGHWEGVLDVPLHDGSNGFPVLKSLLDFSPPSILR